jgi:hypothetical protein
MPELYELKIVAVGEVRDADGNLIEQVPIEQTVTLTEEQVEALVAEEET